jgi:hypothetical protein
VQTFSGASEVQLFGQDHERLQQTEVNRQRFVPGHLDPLIGFGRARHRLDLAPRLSGYQSVTAHVDIRALHGDFRHPRHIRDVQADRNDVRLAHRTTVPRRAVDLGRTPFE